MLLINGMPVIHIELKRSGVDVTQAVNQIKKYVHEGVFARGIFSLVQIFVAMTPEKTLYFANPGEEKKFSPSFYFHWADSNNDETFDWKRIAANLLSIPMAHQLVGSYTIADVLCHRLLRHLPYANELWQQLLRCDKMLTRYTAWRLLLNLLIMNKIEKTDELRAMVGNELETAQPPLRQVLESIIEELK